MFLQMLFYLQVTKLIFTSLASSRSRCFAAESKMILDSFMKDIYTVNEWLCDAQLRNLVFEVLTFWGGRPLVCSNIWLVCGDAAEVYGTKTQRFWEPGSIVSTGWSQRTQHEKFNGSFERNICIWFPFAMTLDGRRACLISPSCDYFVRCFLKAEVYKYRPTNIGKLKDAIRLK